MSFSSVFFPKNIFRKNKNKLFCITVLSSELSLAISKSWNLWPQVSNLPSGGYRDVGR